MERFVYTAVVFRVEMIRIRCSEGRGPPGGAEACGYKFNMSLNLDTRQQQSCTVHNSRYDSTRKLGAFVRSVRVRLLTFCSTAAHGRSAADVNPAYAATLRRTVYESSFQASKEAYETSQ